MVRRGSFRLVLVIFLVSCFFSGFAQEEETLTDTLYTAPTEEVFEASGDTFSVQTRTVPDTLVKRLQADPDYWYAQSAPNRVKEKEPERGSGGSFMNSNTFWLIVIILFVGLLILFLASSNIHLFRRRSTDLEGESPEISEENLFELDYDAEIRKAVAREDFRLATRLWYLQTLKALDESALIQFKPGRTNSFYVQQLRGTDRYPAFAQLTRNFEYAWYGQFMLTAERFERWQQDFVNFKQGLSR